MACVEVGSERVILEGSSGPASSRLPTAGAIQTPAITRSDLADWLAHKLPPSSHRCSTLLGSWRCPTCRPPRAPSLLVAQSSLAVGRRGWSGWCLSPRP